MITEVEKLELVLKGLGCELGGMTLGEKESTPEEIARAIRKSIISVIIRGEGSLVDLNY